MEGYRRPILTAILGVIGWLTVALGLATLLLALFLDIAENKTIQVAAALPSFVLLVTLGVIELGIAQVIDYLGKTAFATEQLLALTQASAAPAQDVQYAPIPAAPPSETALPPAPDWEAMEEEAAQAAGLAIGSRIKVKRGEFKGRFGTIAAIDELEVILEDKAGNQVSLPRADVE